MTTVPRRATDSPEHSEKGINHVRPVDRSAARPRPLSRPVTEGSGIGDARTPRYRATGQVSWYGRSPVPMAASNVGGTDTYADLSGSGDIAVNFDEGVVEYSGELQ